MNRQPQKVEGAAPESPEIWELRYSQDLKGESLDEMLEGKKRKLGSTSNRKTEHQVRDRVVSHSQNSDL